MANMASFLDLNPFFVFKFIRMKILFGLNSGCRMLGPFKLEATGRLKHGRIKKIRWHVSISSLCNELKASIAVNIWFRIFLVEGNLCYVV